ncbi:PTS sugar transporter subunit IIA [Sandarakinorhabdus sp.]|uniref:PTS sugar transporter subunit IIA n=1 Tax=Sandarakinorhabdus sp. TaxID=1916663 RepID=UPI003341C129
MIGLVLVTHGGLADEFRAAMEHVVGPQAGVAAICIAADDDDMEKRRADIAAAVISCNSGQGVIILTDMFGGTPSNLAISLLGPQVEVIAGVNLPMLIKLASVRKSGTVAAAVQAAQDAGRKYIAVASRMLGEAA